MHSHHAACKSAVLADTHCCLNVVGVKFISVKLCLLPEFLLPFSSMPKLMNHMAVVKFNFSMLGDNYVDLVGSLKIFRGCFKVKGFYWPSTLCDLGLEGHVTCCCNGKHLLLTSDLLMGVLPGSDTFAHTHQKTRSAADFFRVTGTP